jgi:ADP-L-glycero-D-manno-heptose 6-epimerase
MIIVTGGAGFIGSCLVKSLEDAGIGPIVICDYFGKDQKWRNISKRLLQDVIPPKSLFDFLENNKNRVEAIFHLGAISATTEKDVDLIVENNIRMSAELFKWASRCGVRFIYASSASTYGNGEHGFDDEESLEYLRRLRPLNPYGWSKQVFDQSILMECKTPHRHIPPQWVGLKFFNVYGPNEYHKGTQMSVIPQFLKQIQETGSVKLFESHKPEIPHGEQKRDFVWVFDCVRVMMWLYHHPETSGIFNVGSGMARSFNDVAHALFKAVGKPTQIDYVPLPDSLKQHYQYYTKASMQKLFDKGYTLPFTTLEECISAYVKDYLLTPDPYT